jgi:hypothetical protein
MALPEVYLSKEEWYAGGVQIAKLHLQAGRA